MDGNKDQYLLFTDLNATELDIIFTDIIEVDSRGEVNQ